MACAGTGLKRGTRNCKTQNYLVGRGEADAPDIDGRVYIRGESPVGEFAKVKVIGHTDYDLIAAPIRLLPAGFIADPGRE